MDAPSIATSSFFRTELDRALGENGFALMAWELRGSLHDDSGRGEAAHAEANVELLPEEDSQGDKGRTVEIQLTLRGYQIIHGHHNRQHYETLDDLLGAVSPAYARRRQKLLFAKLEDVAKDRSWDDHKKQNKEAEAEDETAQ